jgi:hypothetical protein
MILVGCPQKDDTDSCPDTGEEGEGLIWPEQRVPASVADYVLVGITSGNQTGAQVAPAGDVDGDGLDDILVGVDLYDGAFLGGGGAFVMMAANLQPEVALGEAALLLTGEGELDVAGHSLLGNYDLDGDGHAEVLVTAYQHDDVELDQGRIYLHWGADLPSTGIQSLGEAPVILEGNAQLDRLGHRVEWVGDVDGDGIKDLLTSSYGASIDGLNVGVAHLISGAEIRDGVWRMEDIAHTNFLGEEKQDAAGFYATGVDDVDGDGRPDLFLAAPKADAGVSNGGVLYPVFSSDLLLGGEVLLDRTKGGISGTVLAMQCCAVASAGDVDGDGRGDVLAGASAGGSDFTLQGEAFLFLAPTLAEDGFRTTDAADLRVTHPQEGAHVGSSVGSFGDWDQDGLGEILVGVAGLNEVGDNAGAVLLFFGADLLGRSELGVEDARHIFLADREWQHFGRSVSRGGDINGDGRPDLLVGAPMEPMEWDRGPGSAYVYLAPSP